jgi:hypothetical protein
LPLLDSYGFLTWQQAWLPATSLREPSPASALQQLQVVGVGQSATLPLALRRNHIMRPHAGLHASSAREAPRPELPLLRRPTSKPRAAQKTSVLDDRLDRHPAADIAQLECRHMRGGGRSGAGTTRRRLRGEALGHAAGELQRHGIAADIVVLQLEANGALPTDADQQLRPDDLCELGWQSATPLQFPA